MPLKPCCDLLKSNIAKYSDTLEVFTFLRSWREVLGLRKRRWFGVILHTWKEESGAVNRS